MKKILNVDVRKNANGKLFCQSVGGYHELPDFLTEAPRDVIRSFLLVEAYRLDQSIEAIHMKLEA